MSVIEEIQQRPLLRPLIFWLTGIILQTCFPLQTLAFVLPIAAAIIILFSFIASGTQVAPYEGRPVWGIVIALITVFMAIEMTHLAEQSRGVVAELSFLQLKAQEVQARMVEKLTVLSLPDNYRAMLATITVNFRRAMSAELRNQFSVGGVSHLLSVSGFHVGIVCAFVRALLSVLPKRGKTSNILKYALSMLMVWSFTYISGLTTAAVRAAIMISIYLTGTVSGRMHDKYNTLAGAAFCMLVYNPFYLYSVGFQLSFIAVFFILYLQPRFSKLITIKNPLIATPWTILTVTLSAQLGTCFLCCFYFGQTSMVFIFTNLALSFLANLLIPATLLWMITPEWMPGFAILSTTVESLARSTMWIVESFASVPGARLALRFDFITMILSYISLFLCILYFRRHRYSLLVATLITVIVIIAYNIYR
ncbi:MAG: ComEC/Rec2 family competence protein [Tannerella sp.]|nr:ComEC/Rec2 family competence protein [Tannerella sp.]